MRIRCLLKVCCPGRRFSTNFTEFLPIPSNHLARRVLDQGTFEEFHLNSSPSAKMLLDNSLPYTRLDMFLSDPDGPTVVLSVPPFAN